MKGRVKTKVQTLPQPPSQKEQCHHYWFIDVANGPTSGGTCKNCGARKEFLNAFPEYNPLRKPANPLALPKIQEVAVDEGDKALITR